MSKPQRVRTWRDLILLERRGGELVAAALSESARLAPRHQVIVPLDPALPIRCGPTCPRAGQKHWHRDEAGEDLRRAYAEIRASQASLSTETLLQTAETTHPDNIGVVTPTFLAAMQTLHERRALPRQARAA